MNAIKKQIEVSEPEVELSVTQSTAENKKSKSILNLLVRVLMKRRADLDLQTWRALEYRNVKPGSEMNHENRHHNLRMHW